MSILNYLLADKEKKERLREGYGDVLKNTNTYNMITNANMIPKVVAGVGGEYIKDAANSVKDFAGNMTFNPLPYGKYARSAYDGMQNIYGKTLDSMYDNVGDFFRPDRQGPMSSGNIASRGMEKAEELFHTMPDGTVMPGASHNNNPHDMTKTELSTMKTEAEMGSSPVQELDTGPFDLAVEDLPLVAKKGPLVRGTYDDYISERDSRARLNSKLEYERMQTRR